VLAGLGIDELSVSIPAIGSVKAQLARLTMAEARKLAADVLRLGTAAEVRAHLSSFAD
jgi:multiphosphoryl transfer protein